MLKANELRIGNWVYEKGRKPFAIDADYICDFANGFYKFNPVEITEEWLIKFGLEEYKDFGYKTKNFYLIPLQGFTYNLETKKVMIMQKGNIQSHWLENDIQYVHQLQNLYFALTGNELQYVE